MMTCYITKFFIYHVRGFNVVGAPAGTRLILKVLEELLTWSRMKCKPKKSRSVVVKCEKVTDSIRFEVQGERIPTVSESPVKFLRKWFYSTKRHVDNTRKTKKQTVEWPKAIDKTELPGNFKVWCYQYGLLTRLQWPLLIYNIPLSTAEALDR